MTLEERVVRLEQDNRRTTRTLLVVAAVGLVAGVVGLTGGTGTALVSTTIVFSVALWATARTAFRVPEVVQARKIEIVSGAGQVLVALGETATGDGAVATYDANGRTLGHVSRVHRDEYLLREPDEAGGEDKAVVGRPTPRIENRH